MPALVITRSGAIVTHAYYCERCCGAVKGGAVYVPRERSYGAVVTLGRSERHPCAGCGATISGSERGPSC